MYMYYNIVMDCAVRKLHRVVIWTGIYDYKQMQRYTVGYWRLSINVNIVHGGPPHSFPNKS